MAVKALTSDEEDEMIEAGMLGEIIYLQGKAYRECDLYHCSGCDLTTVHASDLDDEGRCWDCAEAAAEEDGLDDLDLDFDLEEEF